MTILYPNHTNDLQEYIASRALWRQLFDQIKCADYQGPMWTQWMETTYANGTPCYDDSMPIYTQWCEERGKGIKIWQHDPAEDWASADFFDARMEPWGEFGEVDTLDISCVLTEGNLARAEALILLYMVDDLSAEEMSQRLEPMFPHPDSQASAERPLALVSLDYGLRKHFCALRGMRGEGFASYVPIPGPDFVLSARMSFSASACGSSIAILAQVIRREDKLCLTYQLCDADGNMLAEGPSGALSVGCDAPDDARRAEDWLDAIRQFIEDNRNLRL